MQKRGLFAEISTNIILLGLVSFFMDASSEMIIENMVRKYNSMGKISDFKSKQGQIKKTKITIIRLLKQ